MRLRGFLRVFSKVDTLAVFMAWFFTGTPAPARRGSAPGNAAGVGTDTSGLAGSLARSAPSTAVTLPVPRTGEALIDAADA